MGRLADRLYAALWIAAAGMLFGGIAWCILSPSTKAYLFGGALMPIPFAALAVDRWGRKAKWVASIIVMLGGVAWFSFAPSTASYWLGGVFFATPFLLMVVDRSERMGFTYRDPPDYGKDNAPWSGP
jgi:hypothetical protein